MLQAHNRLLHSTSQRLNKQHLERAFYPVFLRMATAFETASHAPLDSVVSALEDVLAKLIRNASPACLFPEKIRVS
jgi:hypothetical protein